MTPVMCLCNICSLLPGGAGPLVICSDCYDNANIYSRTREYCPYAYLGEDDPLDKTVPGLKENLSEHAQHEDAALNSLTSNQDSSVFFTSHDKRLSSHTPPEHYGESCKQKFQFYFLNQYVYILGLLQTTKPFPLRQNFETFHSDI